MNFDRLFLSGVIALMVAGCTSTPKTIQRPMSEAERTARAEDFTKAVKDLSKAGKVQDLPPYPSATAIPKESAACKGLVSKDRHMSLSVSTINLIAATGQRPWAIYLFDVDGTGQAKNVRLVKSAGLNSANFDFKLSVESWRFASPVKPVKGCVAEMRIT